MLAFMKIMNPSRCLYLLLLFLFSFSIDGYSQTYSIDDVKFKPPDPQPESTIRLRVSLYPSEQADEHILIRLITLTDLNDDCKYAYPGEEVEHPLIKVKDNEKGTDEDSLKDEILVRIYEVPKDHPPQKYTAIVTFGQDYKSASIIVPPQKTPVCNPTDDWSIRNALRIPYNVAQNLRGLKDILKGEGAQDEYLGEHNLYVCTPKEKLPEKIAHSTEAFYLFPTWSFDSKKIAIIANQGGTRKLAWTDIEHQNLQVVTTGPDDRSPFWLPDNMNIIFVRDNRLQIVNAKSREVKAIAKNVWIDQILGISQEAGNTVQVIFEAPNKYTAETKEVYMLELDKQFEPKDVFHLVNNPIWFLITAASPSGDQVIYGEANTLFISLVNGEKAERLFEDEYRYNEPSWSPDGNKIAFVSNRPQ